MKRCSVPLCQNTCANAPNKIFIYVPKNPEVRKLWCDAVGCKKVLGNSDYYCCEDHFNLEEDAENLMQFKLMKYRLRLKKGVVPSKFIDKVSDDVDFTQAIPLLHNKRVLVPNYNIDNMPSTSKQARLINLDSEEIQLSINEQPSPTKSSESSKASSGECVSTPSSYSSSSTSTSYQMDEMKKMSQKRIFLLMESESRFYLGLPKDVYFIIKLASHFAKLNYLDILITLKKIRLNDAYFRMAHDFGVSSSFIGRAVDKAMKPLAIFFKNAVFWPSKDIIFANLPMAFRRRYYNVTSIIDCFEIEMQKPSNPVHQALTWSSYKNANTLKYLVSITPSGLINFVSEGFGGRISDVEIVQNSGYLDLLPEKTTVMSDRGFKNLSYILTQKNCLLVRPPSVSKDKTLSKEEVMEGKRIASVRIHVERLISRIREFHLLKPHAVIDIHFLGKMNFAVVIACGIINLQPALVQL